MTLVIEGSSAPPDALLGGESPIRGANTAPLATLAAEKAASGPDYNAKRVLGFCPLLPRWHNPTAELRINGEEFLDDM